MPVSDLSLEPLATPAGVFCMLALDHRDALRNAFRRAGVEDVSAELLLDVKARIARVLGDGASGILLDHAAVACRPPHAGLLLPLEAQGHEPLDAARLNRLEFDAAQARGLGADGCKLLLWYRADHPASAALQRELLARAAEDCHRHGLPLILEPLVYKLEGESDEAYTAAFADLVVAAAAELHDCDLLKLQFPGSAAACARATEAAAPLRWALLGGSEVDGETFAGQLTTAIRAGASGFIAGRAIWGGVLGLPVEEQEPWLRRKAIPLFERLVAAAHD
jgi:tagatose 1,6-diphosphate aldolase